MYRCIVDSRSQGTSDTMMNWTSSDIVMYSPGTEELVAKDEGNS
jgi:hypothetical protein